MVVYSTTAVAHSIYGIPSTINSANYMYFLAMDGVVKLNSFEALKVFTGTCELVRCLSRSRLFV